MENRTPENAVRRLPLWENALAEMRAMGVDYGATFSRDWLEEQLSCQWNTAEFNGAVHEIRCALEHDGLFLSARGQGNAGYVILSPAENTAQALRNQRHAISLLRRTVTLLTNTNIDTLDEDQRRRQEAVLQRAAVRAALVSRKIPLDLRNGGEVT